MTRRCLERVRGQISFPGAIKPIQEQTRVSTDGSTPRALPPLRTLRLATSPASIPPYDRMVCITLTLRFSRRLALVRKVDLGLNRGWSFLAYSIELNLPRQTQPVALRIMQTLESSPARRREPIHD